MVLKNKKCKLRKLVCIVFTALKGFRDTITCVKDLYKFITIAPLPDICDKVQNVSSHFGISPLSIIVATSILFLIYVIIKCFKR